MLPEGRPAPPLTGFFQILVGQLRQGTDIENLYKSLQESFNQRFLPQRAQVAMTQAMQALEVMVSEGWVDAKLNKKKPKLDLKTPQEGGMIHPNRSDKQRS